MGDKTPIKGVPIPPHGTAWKPRPPSHSEGTPMPAPSIPPPVASSGHSHETQMALMQKDIENVHKAYSEVQKQFTNYELEFEVIKSAVAPKPRSFAPLIGVFLTITIFVTGIIWQAAKYPSREEYDRRNQIFGDQLKTVEDEITTLRFESAAMKTNVQSLQDLTKHLSDQLDQLNRAIDRMNRGR